jgi:hypothetical protein
MTGTHFFRRARRLPARLLAVGIPLALAAAVGMPGVAFALFASQPAAQTASVTAATIGAATNFTATATGRTTANLAWTAPSILTGYKLSQSPGTLAGCSATPSASTTSCTATGLSPGTVYTWTLTAVYDNWQSSPVQASTRTTGVSAALVGTATDTSASSSTSVNGLTTTSGATLLILVYRQATTGNPAISSVTGSAISGSATAINNQKIDGSYGVFAWRASASGAANGTVTVTFTNANNVSTTIDVVQLAGNNTTTPIAGSAVSTGTGTTATGGTLSPGTSTDGEVFFAGTTASSTMSTPSGYTVLNVPSSTVHGSWSSSSASSTGVSTALGTSGTWGTIEIEISHA